MAAGYDDTTIRNTAYLSMIESVIQDYTIFANRNVFKNYEPTGTPGGENISWVIDYDVTNNGGVMSSLTDPAPESDALARVIAYQTKDYFQHSVQIYDILINQIETNFNGSIVPTDEMMTAIQNSARLMAADMASAAISDLLTMIDSAGSFSDAALLRSTYNLASYEGTSVGTLALSDLDTAIRTLRTKEYGLAARGDLAIMVDTVNQQRIASLSGGVAYKELNASSDGNGNIDAGIAHRVATYQGIDILEEDALGSSDILFLRKDKVEFYDHWKPAIKDINVAAWQQKKLMGMGSNVIVKNPRYCAKLSGITG